MKEFTEKIQGPLSVNDRSILSSAYKNVVTLRRNSWRTLTNILKYESSGLKCRLIEEYIGVVVKELMDLCNEVLVNSLRTWETSVCVCTCVCVGEGHLPLPFSGVL